MKYLTILLLILQSCFSTPDTRPLITQRFVVFYPNYRDTISFSSKDIIFIRLVTGGNTLCDDSFIYFTSIAPIKKL